MTKYNWTEQQEQLLITWAEKSSGYSWLHSKSINYYRYKNLWISMPAAVISYIAGSTSLIVSDNNDKYKSLGIGFAGIISGILVNFQEVFKYKELSEQHRICYLRYLTFFRDISTELSLHPKDRHNAIDYIKSKKLEFGKLLEQSPIIPQNIINMFEEKFKHVKIHKPDIATNLQTILAYSESIPTNETNDMEDITKWLKKRRVTKNMVEVANSNSNSDCESNTDMIEIANSSDSADDEFKYFDMV